jgi:hypothetical protein
MAVLNVASLIASRGFRVLIIDFDLEAPGLSHLIGKEAIPEKVKSSRKSPPKQILKPGVVELLSDAVLRGPESDLLSKPFPQVADKYTFSYSPPEGLKQHPGAKLSIMPAGRLDEEYSARLDQLDLPGLYKEPENSGKRLILRFRDILIRSNLYDYILVDSRTGHSDEAGICTRDLADHRMIVSGLNTQNITGTANVVNAALGTGVKRLLHVSSNASIGKFPWGRLGGRAVVRAVFSGGSGLGWLSGAWLGWLARRADAVAGAAGGLIGWQGLGPGGTIRRGWACWR